MACYSPIHLKIGRSYMNALPSEAFSHVWSASSTVSMILPGRSRPPRLEASKTSRSRCNFFEIRSDQIWMEKGRFVGLLIPPYMEVWEQWSKRGLCIVDCHHVFNCFDNAVQPEASKLSIRGIWADPSFIPRHRLETKIQ